MAVFELFIYLQVLDLLTTLVGFKLGATEASPIIRMLMQAGPTFGVVFSKLVAIGLGGLCLYLRRERLLKCAVYWYSGLVAWNLVVILAAPGRIAG